MLRIRFHRGISRAQKKDILKCLYGRLALLGPWKWVTVVKVSEQQFDKYGRYLLKFGKIEGEGFHL